MDLYGEIRAEAQRLEPAARRELYADLVATGECDLDCMSAVQQTLGRHRAAQLVGSVLEEMGRVR